MVCWIVCDNRPSTRAATGAVLFWLLRDGCSRKRCVIGDISMFDRKKPRRVEYLTIDSRRVQGRRAAKKHSIEGAATLLLGAVLILINTTTTMRTIGGSVVAAGLGLLVLAVSGLFGGEATFTWHQVE